MDCYKLGSKKIKKSEVGAKAYNIERLYEAGFKVPRSVFLKGKDLNKIFIEDNKEEYEEIAKELNHITYAEGMRQWNKGLVIPEELETVCDNFYKRKKTVKYVARSSADCEDEDNESYAGLFETYKDIESSKDLAEAVKNVFASKYSSLIDSKNDIQMSVVLQEQIDPDVSGVAFSKNPLTEENEIVVNYYKGDCENVVSGQAGSELIIGKRKNSKRPSSELPEILVEELQDNICKIEKLFKAPVDVEWAYSNKSLYILQARKITTKIVKETITKENLYLDTVETSRLERIDLSQVKKSHKKYMEKHYYIRKKALEAGIKFPEVGYLFYNKKTLSNQVFEEIVPKSRVYKVVSDEAIRTLGKRNVVPYLKTLPNDDGIVRIQEITRTDACGNASITGDGNIYVEYIKGGFGGFIFGQLPFSSIVVSPEGKILSSNLFRYDVYWKYNGRTRKFDRTPCEPAEYKLSKKVIFQIIDMAKKVNSISNNVRFEWELEGTIVYLNDVTFENKEIFDSNLNQKELSPGKVKGEIRVIDDFDDIKKIIKNRSVIAESSFYEAERSSALEEYLLKHKIQKNKKYVFVCNYAAPSLAILIRYASGFIFEKGGMLSHLAIILREKGVPGIIEEGALKNYKNGERK